MSLMRIGKRRRQEVEWGGGDRAGHGDHREGGEECGG